MVTATIIICTRNRAESLRETLRCMQACELPSGMEVTGLVADNGSTDLTREVVASAGGPIPFRWLLEPRVGKSHAYNSALQAAQGDVLLFADDDVRVPRNWIAAMSRQLLSGEADAVQGGVRAAPHLRRRWLIEGFPSMCASTENVRTSRPDFLIGANMAMSRRVLQKVSRFDPELGVGSELARGEETLFAWQLLQAGYRIGSELDVVAEHHFDASRLKPSIVAETCRKSGRAKAYLAYHWKHAGVLAFDWSGCLRRTVAYSWRRLFHSADWAAEEPPQYWKLPLIEASAFVRQYARERRRTRNYVRYGLSRIA